MNTIFNYIRQQRCNTMKLGDLSAKYESNGDPGAHSNNPNDKGGPSYGLYQLALNTGSLAAYVKQSCYYSQLHYIPIGSPAFTERWKLIAELHPDEFAQDQYNYHMSVYYTPVRKHCDKYKIPDTNAINQVIWSTSTQQGPSWAKKVFKELAGKSEHDIIESVYLLRRNQFLNSEYYNANDLRKKVRDSVLNRYKHELNDALQLIKSTV